MAILLDKEIEKFLSIGYSNSYCNSYCNGYGNGYGIVESRSGNGYGGCDSSGNGHCCSNYGCGNSKGSGYDDSKGSGYGYCDNSGYSNDGYGIGYGIVYNNDIKQLNGHTVYEVDGINTLIYSVHGNYAKGAILKNNVCTEPCFIAKVEDFFAHGETLHKAFADATSKAIRNTPIKARIERFHNEFPDFDKKVDASILFRWHNILTGSCEMGKRSFCESRGIDYENGKYSVNEFLDICKDAYGWDNIKLIKE